MPRMSARSWRWLALATTVGIAALRPDARRAAVAEAPERGNHLCGLVHRSAAGDPEAGAARRRIHRRPDYRRPMAVHSKGATERLPAIGQRAPSPARSPPSWPSAGRDRCGPSRHDEDPHRGRWGRSGCGGPCREPRPPGRQRHRRQPSRNGTGSETARATQAGRARRLACRRLQRRHDARQPSGRVAGGGKRWASRSRSWRSRRCEDLEGAFQAARGWRAQGLNVLASPLLNGLRRTIIERAARYRLPAVHQWPESVRTAA